MERIDYTVQRSRRRTVAICIKDGKVCVKAPLKTQAGVIERFVAEKSNWIAKKLAQNRQKLEAFSDVLACRAFLWMGKPLPFNVVSQKTVRIQNGRLCVPQSFCANGVPQRGTAFERALQRVYKRAAQPVLESRLREIADTIGLSYTSFSLTNAKTKWGSCDPQNGICLNWRLVLLDQALLDYVIVHELAHTKEHNHSKAFWLLVQKHYPKYKEAVRWLKECGILCTLYA